MQRRKVLARPHSRYLLYASLTAAFMLSGWGLLARDYSKERVPASFDRPKRSLGKLIRFPKGTRDIEVAIRCKAWVNLQHMMRTTYCLQEADQLRPFYKAVKRASKRARVYPARHGGEAIASYVAYTVSFVRKDGAESVRVVANWGLNRAKYGEDYSAAQYIWSPHEVGRECRPKELITLVLEIDAAGIVQGITNPGADLSKDCEKMYEDHLYHSKWVPAFFEGQAVGSQLVVYFGRR